MGINLKHYNLKGLRLQLLGVAACNQFFAPIFGNRSDELFLVALLNVHCEVIELLTFDGQPDKVEVGIAQLFHGALQAHAEALILAHNHPSGDDRPSRSDKILTKSLVIACEALELTLLDHLIFGDDEVFSFRQRGLL